MAAKSRTRASPKIESPLADFTREYFTRLGATVRAAGSTTGDQLYVELTPALATHFGREKVRLAFHSAEPIPGVELVAHGSRLFDQMMALLDSRGAFTVLRAPVRHSGGEALMSAVRFTNASVNRLRMQDGTRTLFAFTWRITYRADDKRQEIFSIWLDDEGRLLAQSGATDAHQTIEALDQMLADAEAAPGEVNKAGETLPPKLPPLAQLVRLAEQARAYATYHADVRCVSHEAEILPRLYRSLNRLITYYQDQIDETQPARDPEGERRRALEADLQRKIIEEVESHRLRIDVELIGYVALETPTAVADITLRSGRHEVAVRIEQDRYSGVLRRPDCHACGAETNAVTIDHNGHITCERCTQLCATCNELFCTVCGVAPCPVCGAENCATCGRTCWACGEHACTEHIDPCPICGDSVCHACQTTCAACGVRQCRSHLRLDCVAGAAEEAALICPRCAVRCPGCRQYSAQHGVCSASGQRFCQNCLVTCTSCSRVIGPGFYAIDAADQRPYCNDCLRECPSCHALSHDLTGCVVCGRQGCAACVARCIACDRAVCAEHGMRLPSCQHLVCNRDLVECSVCHELVCPRCAATCPICAQHVCENDLVGCIHCGQEYCRTCVSHAGLCATCATVAAHGVAVDRDALDWGDDEQVRTIAPHYRWVAAGNRRYDIYVGEGAMMTTAVVVVERRGDQRRIVWLRRLTVLERLREMLRL